MQHRGHPPAEVLGAPDAAQAAVRVGVQPPEIARLVPLGQSVRQLPHVADREVEALGAGGRDDVRRVAGQEQRLVLHRLRYEAAHRRDALLDDRAVAIERPALAVQARLELVPDLLVGPVVGIVVRVTLDVEAAQLRRAHAVQREAALVARVDQLLGRGRDLGEDPEPA